MNCEQLKSMMADWVGQETECHLSGTNALAVTLPLLKPNGDPIEIGIEQIDADRWRLSDFGDTHANLYLAGVELGEELVRADEFRHIVSSHNIIDADEELTFETQSSRLAGGVFEFVHAIQSVMALQLAMRVKQPTRDFPSIVAKFFAEQRASFEVPAQPVSGKTGRWRFNFILNTVKEPTLVKALSAGSKRAAMRDAKQTVFEVLDVRGANPDLAAVVVADDEEDKHEFWQRDVMRVFGGYDVLAYGFYSNRQELTELAQQYAS